MRSYCHFLLAALLSACAPAPAQEVIFLDGFQRLPPNTVSCPSRVGSASNALLQSADPNGAALYEISGLVLSRTQQADGAAVLWVHNDSGGGARFSAYSQFSGARLKSFRLSAAGVDATDWEDIALAPCGDSSADCLYIGNIGNNPAREIAPVGTAGRTVLEIYKFPEPNLDASTDNQIISKNVQVLSYRYGAGSPTLSADAEALWVDPTGDAVGGAVGDIYVMTKWNAVNASLRRVYKYAVANQGSAIAAIPALAANVAGATNTRADLSRRGDLILIADYSNARIYTRTRTQSIELALSVPPCLTMGLPPGATQFQFEAAGFNADASEIVEISECTSPSNCEPPIHRTLLKR